MPNSNANGAPAHNLSVSRTPIRNPHQLSHNAVNLSLVYGKTWPRQNSNENPGKPTTTKAKQRSIKNGKS